MRRRSGAMHCETQIEYLELASNVDTSSGLFYNDAHGKFRTKRRKYGISLEKNSQNSSQTFKNQQYNQKSKNAFSGFDFDQQSHSFSKDYQELEMSQKYLSTRTNKNNFLILTKNNPNITLIQLSRLRNIHPPPLFHQYMLESHPPIQLFMDKKVNQTCQTTFIDCYWIVDVLQIEHYRYLFDVYISSCSKILLLFDDDIEDVTFVQTGTSSSKGTLEEFTASIDEEREIY